MKTKFEIYLDGDALFSLNVLCNAYAFLERRKLSDFLEEKSKNDEFIFAGYPSLFYCNLDSKEKECDFERFLSDVISKLFVFEENNFESFCGHLYDKYDYFKNDSDRVKCKDFEEFYKKKFVKL